MHVAASARLFLARRPWVYWTLVAAFAAILAMAVHLRLSAIDTARASWGSTRSVLVADRAMMPGDPLSVSPSERPLAAIPQGALSAIPDGARVRQRIAAGEVLVDVDITPVAGPAGRADPDTVVVAVADPLARAVTIGTRVQVAADGLLLATDATIVELVDEIIYIAVEPRAAPAIAAAAQANLVSLLYLP